MKIVTMELLALSMPVFQKADASTPPTTPFATTACSATETNTATRRTAASLERRWTVTTTSPARWIHATKRKSDASTPPTTPFATMDFSAMGAKLVVLAAFA
jgi:hypothetical protein